MYGSRLVMPLAALLTAGCAYTPIVDRSSPSFNEAAYNNRLEQCRRAAEQISPNEATAGEAMAGAAVGAIVGSVGGSSGIALGASSGAMTGAMVGNGKTQYPRDMVIRRCLRLDGYRVIR